MPESLPAFALELLPDDPDLLRGLQKACDAALVNGIFLRPHKDGTLGVWPADLASKHPAIVAGLRRYKPQIEAILRIHPAFAMFTDVCGEGETWTVCPACMLPVKQVDGTILHHRTRDAQVCLPLTPTRRPAV